MEFRSSCDFSRPVVFILAIHNNRGVITLCFFLQNGERRVMKIKNGWSVGNYWFVFFLQNSLDSKGEHNNIPYVY